MSFAVERIDHVELFVRDIDIACRWYRETLGLVEIYRWDPEPVMIGAGGTKLALFRAEPGALELQRAESGDTLRWHRVAWLTDRAGFEEAQRHLKKVGVAYRGPIDHDRTWSIYFADPDAHPLEITCDK